MHVVNKHNVGLEIMEQFAPVQGDLLVTQQQLVARTETVELVVVIIGVLMQVSTSLVNVTGASLTIISQHFFKTEKIPFINLNLPDFYTCFYIQ
jgi:peptidyl-tRNA hydrolase